MGAQDSDAGCTDIIFGLCSYKYRNLATMASVGPTNRLVGMFVTDAN